MSGNVQTQASQHDPAPQFAVYEVEQVEGSRRVVTGRCWFGPILLGTRFTRLVPDPTKAPEAELCDLEVRRIEMYGKPSDRLDQMVTARLSLVGGKPLPIGNHEERVLLVGEAPPEGAWMLREGLWRRSLEARW